MHLNLTSVDIVNIDVPCQKEINNVEKSKEEILIDDSDESEPICKISDVKSQFSKSQKNVSKFQQQISVINKNSDADNYLDVSSDDDDIQFVEKVVKREVPGNASAETEMEPDPSLINQLFICPICDGKSANAAQVQIHLVRYHKISLEKQQRMNLEIQSIFV